MNCTTTSSRCIKI